MSLTNQEEPCITVDDVSQVHGAANAHAGQIEPFDSATSDSFASTDCRSQMLNTNESQLEDTQLPPPHRFHRKAGKGANALTNLTVVDQASHIKQTEYLSMYRRSTGRYLCESESGKWIGSKSHIQKIAQYIFQTPQVATD